MTYRQEIGIAAKVLQAVLVVGVSSLVNEFVFHWSWPGEIAVVVAVLVGSLVPSRRQERAIDRALEKSP